MQLNIQNPAKCRTWNSFQRGWHWQEGHSSTHLVALVCWPGYKSSHYRIPYRRSYLVEQRIAAESWAFGRFGLGPKRTIGWGINKGWTRFNVGKDLKTETFVATPTSCSFVRQFLPPFCCFFWGCRPQKNPKQSSQQTDSHFASLVFFRKALERRKVRNGHSMNFTQFLQIHHPQDHPQVTFTHFQHVSKSTLNHESSNPQPASPSVTRLENDPPPQPPTASLRCAPSTAEKCHLSHCTRRFGTLTQDGTPWKAGMLGRKKHGEFNEKQTQQ